LPPDAQAPTKYYKFGATRDNGAPHWYDFGFDPSTSTGAVFPGQADALTGEVVPAGQIYLHFIDGQRATTTLRQRRDHRCRRPGVVHSGHCRLAYDPATKVLTITGAAAANVFAFQQITAADVDGLHTTYSFTLNGATQSYADTQLSQVVVTAMAGPAQPSS